MQAPGVSVPPRLHTDVNVQHNFDSMCTEHALYALQLQFHHHLMPHTVSESWACTNHTSSVCPSNNVLSARISATADMYPAGGRLATASFVRGKSS